MCENANSILTAKDFSAGYSKPLFSSVNLYLNVGELAALIGPNGTGKSTLLKTFAGLLRPQSGTVSLCDKPMESYAMRERAQKIASVFTRENVPYGMTVREFVSLGRIPFSGLFDARNAEDISAVDSAIQSAQLENFENRKVQELSDGERSRVFMARAIASNPKVLLLDEPTAFLDVPNILNLFRYLKKMASENQVAVLVSTHHVDYALKFSDRILCMDGKGLVQEGTPSEIQNSKCLEWANAV